MAGRAEFFRQQNKNAQRPLGYVKPKPVDDSEWISEGMDTCREIAASQDNVWGVHEYSIDMQVTPKEADRQLRHLSKLGFLTMGTERRDGNFVRYTWGMVNVDLPRK